MVSGGEAGELLTFAVQGRERLAGGGLSATKQEVWSPVECNGRSVGRAWRALREHRGALAVHTGGTASIRSRFHAEGAMSPT